MIKVNDITAVLCVRLHEGNPWIKDRLRLISEYYSPLPKVLIVDFGTVSPYREELEVLCKGCNFDYHYVDDQGVYSAAIAHNRGFEKVTTELVFFFDVDFFFKREIFRDLVEAASALEMDSNVDIFIDFAAYHLTKEYSEEFESIADNEDKSSLLQKAAYLAPIKKQGEMIEFIAPYSNVYLMSTKLYSLVGGYHEDFRGHGSEDFEFFVRLAMHTKISPLPQELDSDKYGATKRDFYWVKQYRGFRRLNEALAMPAELMGFKAFHLWHPTGLANDWRSENDWRRERFRDVLKTYQGSPRNLISIDYISRSKKALCICIHEEHYGYFMPLRLAGYNLIPVFGKTPAELKSAFELIKNNEVDAFSIFNPYMKSHKDFYPLFLLAREQGLKTIVVERGALPKTIYYASDVSYVAEEFSQSEFLKFEPSVQQISQTESYIRNIRSGMSLLENGDSYAITSDKYLSLAKLKKLKCFIPLQLDDDMAVTKYVRPGQCYAEFVASLNGVARANPDVLFLIKPHPLSKVTPDTSAENIIVVDRQDNIHALLDAVDFVVCYNSGVGLLSLIHEKPTITIGNAFYNMPGTGVFSNSLAEAISVGRKLPVPSKDIVARLISWYINSVYSEFTASDDIREFSTRKSHAYKDILLTRFVLDGALVPLGRPAAEAFKTSQNYIFAKMNVSVPIQIDTPQKTVDDKQKTPSQSGSKAQSANKSQIPNKPQSLNKAQLVTKSQVPNKPQQPALSKKERLLLKLKNDPQRYFKDSKHILLRPLQYFFGDTLWGRFNQKIISKMVP